jgi:hypothetical protein
MNWKGLQIGSNLTEVISWYLLAVTEGPYHMFRIHDDTVHIRNGGVRAQTRACKAPKQRIKYCLLFRCGQLSDLTVLEGQIHCCCDISLKYSLPFTSL